MQSVTRKIFSDYHVSFDVKFVEKLVSMAKQALDGSILVNVGM